MLTTMRASSRSAGSMSSVSSEGRMLGVKCREVASDPTNFLTSASIFALPAKRTAGRFSCGNRKLARPIGSRSFWMERDAPPSVPPAMMNRSGRVRIRLSISWSGLRWSLKPMVSMMRA
jgi:hypothetical protein